MKSHTIKCKAPLDDVQTTRIIILLTYLWSSGPLNIVNIENGHFCHVLVSAFKLEMVSDIFI